MITLMLERGTAMLDKKKMTEEEIKLHYITPAILEQWHKSSIRMEFFFTAGKITIDGKKAKRGEANKADYLLYHGDVSENYPIAVVEAKDNNHSVLGGLPQAIRYAKILKVPFAFASNGDAFSMDIKKLLCSERSRKAYKYHHIKDQLLDDSVVKSSSLIIICYMALFGIGTMIGTFYGYPLTSSAFEAASVTGNVGLSIGVTSPAMPVVMKIYYIIAMYMGRLEFLSVFALIGYVAGGIKKLCVKSLKFAS